MSKKIFTDESLETFVDEIKTHISEEVSKKANTSHTHSISDITNLQTQLDNKSNSNHTHSSIKTVGDKRSVATTPNDYANILIFQGLKNNSTITAPSSNSGIYSYVVGLRGWTDSSGGDSHELAFNNDGLFLREGSTTSWGDWRRVYDSLHKPTLSELGAAASSHTHSYAASSSVGGAATSANKLNTNAGDSNTPVYFSNGIPVACTSLDLNTSGNAATATNVSWSGVTSKPSYYDAKAIKSIARSGTTFTYTCMDGTTGTFTQQDNNTTYSAVTTSANGLMIASDKTKLDGMVLATVSEVKTYLGI